MTRRWQVAGTVAVATAMVGVGLGVAAADENGSSNAREGSIVCPQVAGELPAIPQQAAAEVTRNLELLNTQVAEANARFASSKNEGGANFVQNAILGPLKGKRTAVINRIATAIGRQAEKPVLAVDALSTCKVDAAGGASAQEPAVPPAGVDNGEAVGEDTAAGGAESISCPDFAQELPADIPAQAQAEVDRNLALLDTQIAEADKRLASSKNEGGPNFVQNAILGPLKGKRTAVINRVATAIGRNADKPVFDVETLATCVVANSGGAAEEPAAEEPAAPPAEEPAAEEPEAAPAAGARGTSIVCPDVAGELPADIPAQAQAEVASNLALLDKQIAEAEKRLQTSQNEGGANFVQNAILGPLQGKRESAINRILTAIGRNADRPVLDVAALSVCKAE